MDLILSNRPLLSAGAAWATSQVLKLLLYSFLEKRFHWALLFETGRMPSAHSAFVTGLAAGIGMSEGLGSSLFALSFVFATVVMYDALSLRREAGKHADILNELLMVGTIREAISHREFPLRELLGHSPTEVLAGVVIGISVAFAVGAAI